MAKKIRERKDKPMKKNKKRKSLVKEIIGIFSLITVIALWLSAGSVFINPNQFRYLSILGLAFPFFLGGTLLALVICLLFARKKIWIPILGLLGCLFSIRSYCPINIPSAHPKSCLKVMSYNTMGFATSTKDSAKEEGLLNYVVQSKADIFCYQEGNCIPEKLLGSKILPTFKKVWRYNDTLSMDLGVLGCTTHYPIIKKELICQNGMNGAGVFHLLLDEKDTLRVINCHLQSMGLSADDRKQYHDIVTTLDEKSAESHSVLLISKISKATANRAAQVDSVANYISRNKGKNIIVCGDFNDTPISYAFHHIHQTGLIDAYGATANGIGRSFNQDAIYVRIDHMFCSEHWKPYGCHIDNTISSSDHYPIIAYLKRIEK